MMKLMIFVKFIMLRKYKDFPKKIYTHNFTSGLQDANSFREQVDGLIRNVESGVWECLTCGKIAKTRQHIQNHVETHLGFSHVCNYCGKVYKTSNSLSVHMSTSHK